jgi:hypothetical protein
VKYINIIFLLLASNGINAMEAERKSLASFVDVVSVPENFSIDCRNRILFFELAQNTHNYVDKYAGGDCVSFHGTFVSKGKDSYEPVRKVRSILCKISCLNREWYKQLDKQRNDPVTARTMMQNIGITCYSNFVGNNRSPFISYIVNRFCTLGAQKCRESSCQLYDNNLTPEKVEHLYKEGAILDYWNRGPRVTVLYYWSEKNDNESTKIVEKLLQLGANPDAYYEEPDCSPLPIAVHNNDADKVKLLLSYKAKKRWYWVVREDGRRCIDLFIDCATKDELTEGLIACAVSDYLPEIMQKMIDKGANPSAALPRVFEQIIQKFGKPELAPFVQERVRVYDFLCSQQAYDADVCNKIQNLQAFLSSLADKLEQNKSILNDGI